ncbi:MAG: phosphoenolpyruvate--protein phosphotransferase [Ruminococcus sp.]|nr:phosphoenolpyruvate--protein phosphotransferase [Ruminococcus sp.]MDY3894938.1 phosphoenolpyruvate--protein phosphotransferase [Candidatus Fimenecus sp.]
MTSLYGTGVCRGYAVGNAVVIKTDTKKRSEPEFSGEANELERFKDAREKFKTETMALYKKLFSAAGSKNADILLGHISLCDDPFFISETEKTIKEGKTAAQAVNAVCTELYDIFFSSDDELTKQRSSDINDLKNGITDILFGNKGFSAENVPENSVLVFDELTPSAVSRINRKNTVAVIANGGSVTSHSAILARALSIPTVLGAAKATERINSGDTLAVDGESGEIIIEPDEVTAENFSRMGKEYDRKKEEVKKFINRKTQTKDGTEKTVCANIGNPSDIENVIKNGADGIGLFRTEFLFMDRDKEPTEDEQYFAYSSVIKAMNGKEVIIRTLDVGGDKNIPYLGIPKEDNPFLGFRAIRFCLKNRDIFKVQLRAILRAAVFGNVKIMLPLVTVKAEIDDAKELISECKSELKREHKQFNDDVPIGIMAETPAAVFSAEELAKNSDFFSIGTNDLTGYIMAADRGNPNVGYLYDTGQNAVLAAVKRIISCGEKAGIPVGMCGEAAADEKLIPVFLRWGLDEFSVSPESVPYVRKIISEN